MQGCQCKMLECWNVGRQVDLARLSSTARSTWQCRGSRCIPGRSCALQPWNVSRAATRRSAHEHDIKRRMKWWKLGCIDGHGGSAEEATFVAGRRWLLGERPRVFSDQVQRRMHRRIATAQQLHTQTQSLASLSHSDLSPLTRLRLSISFRSLKRSPVWSRFGQLPTSLPATCQLPTTQI
jgi:hypothetical protein